MQSDPAAGLSTAPVATPEVRLPSTAASDSITTNYSGGYMMRLLCVVFTLACASALFAQVDRGNIQGTATDPSGAVVTGAVVRIVSQATNVAQSTVTGPSGTYAFFALPIGMYNLSVEAKGFRRSDVTGIKVEVNQQAKVDVSLQVGEVTQSVEVAANASLVQTESTDVGTVIDSKNFRDLPL